MHVAAGTSRIICITGELIARQRHLLTFIQFPCCWQLTADPTNGTKVVLVVVFYGKVALANLYDKLKAWETILDEKTGETEFTQRF